MINCLGAQAPGPTSSLHLATSCIQQRASELCLWHSTLECTNQGSTSPQQLPKLAALTGTPQTRKLRRSWPQLSFWMLDTVLDTVLKFKLGQRPIKCSLHLRGLLLFLLERLNTCCYWAAGQQVTVEVALADAWGNPVLQGPVDGIIPVTGVVQAGSASLHIPLQASVVPQVAGLVIRQACYSPAAADRL